MYNLLIVEDERWEREGIANLIDRQKYELDRVATAIDGVEGLSLIESLHPDIIITDIRMPGLSGLEMLEKAAGNISQSVSIVLSGYAEFAYAKKALHLGALDFLTKPVDPQELDEVMTKAMKLLANIKQSGDSGDENRVDLHEILEDRMDAAEAAVFLGVNSLSVIRLAYIIGAESDCMLPPFCVQDGDITCCILRPQDRLPVNGFSSVGIAEYRGSFAETAEKAKMAATRAHFFGLSEPVSYSMIAQKRRRNELAEKEYRLRMSQAVITQKITEVGQVFSEIRSRIHQDIGYDPETVITILTEETGLEEDRYIVEMLKEARTVEKVLQILEERIKNNLLTRQREMNDSEKYVLRHAVNLVIEDYGSSEMNLQNVANLLFLSPNYVGSLFKRSTGISFGDFLCQYRLIRAAELLQNNHSLRVNEIAGMVGIPNVSYFCVQFRNLYGITPANYRKSK